MQYMGIEYIEKRRREQVKVEAQQLFDAIIAHIVVQTPADRYNFTVGWDVRSQIIDDMILQKAKDLFTEIRATLKVTRSSDNSVHGTLVCIDGFTENKKLTTFYWSRCPGKFVNKKTGVEVVIPPSSVGPMFTGTVREWYETFIETLVDAGNTMLREVKETPECIYINRDAATILECSILYKPVYNISGEYSPHVGTLCNRFKVFIDEDLPKNVAIVSHTKNDVRTFIDVQILDMNII